MSDNLLKRELAARLAAHNAPIYTGSEVLHAVTSSMRACRLSDEWMQLRSEVKRLGLTPLPLERHP